MTKHRTNKICLWKINFHSLLLHCNVLKYNKELKTEDVSVNNKLKDKSMDNLFDAVLCLKTREECYAFFEDLCTVLELKAISQRLQVAKMLSEHNVYNDIVNATGASTATISRVNRSLNYGCDGYDIVFKRMKEHQNDE